MTRTTIICTGALMALLALPSRAQQTTSPDEDKTRTSTSHESTSSERTHTDSTSMRHSDKFMDYSFMDTDQDGRISKSEFEQGFAKLDTNSDGYISSDEMRKGAGKHHTSGSRSYRKSDSSTDSNSGGNSNSTTTQP